MNMNPLFLAASASDTVVLESLQDKIMYGLQTTLLGMGVVFSVLIILWAVLSVFKVVFYKPGGGEKTEAKEAAPAPAPAPAPAAAPVTETDDSELVAAITAAIAMTLDAPATSFRVVSFKRTAKK